jgi:hypothetical protein
MPSVIEDIINSYIIDKQNVESEIKISGIINSVNFENTLKHDGLCSAIEYFKKNFVNDPINVECSINFIKTSTGGNMLVKRNIIGKSPEIYQKFRLTYPVYLIRDNILYKFTFANEEPINKDQFDSKNIDCVRMKMRFSKKLTPAFDLHLTLVKEYIGASPLELISFTKNSRDKIFPVVLRENPSFDQCLQFAPWNSTAHELEIEYVNVNNNITEKDFINAINCISSQVADLTNNISGGGDNSNNNDDIDKISNFDKISRNPEPIKISDNISKKIYEIAVKLHGIGKANQFRNSTLKAISTQAYAMDINNWEQITRNPTDWYVTDKAHGIRGFVVIDKVIMVITDKITIIDGSIEEQKITDLEYTILDAEIIDGKIYAFDLLYCGESYIDLSYDIRLLKLQEIAKQFANINLKPIIKLSAKFYNDIAKIMPMEGESMSMSQMSDDFDSYFIKSITNQYNIDGLIFTQASAPYSAHPLKWKPLALTTIDLLIKRNPMPLSVSNCKYWLFCGIRNEYARKFNLQLPKGYSVLFPGIDADKYYPIMFQPTEWKNAYQWEGDNLHHLGKELDGCVGEFSINLAAKKLKLMHIREDRILDVKSNKYFGNDFRIAEMTIAQHLPSAYVTYKMMTSPLSSTDKDSGDLGYFRVHDDKKYKALRTCISVGKTEMYNFIANDSQQIDLHLNWALDIGIGKGQDVNRLREIKVNNVVGIEQDGRAIYELISRKYSSINHSHVHSNSQNNPLGIYTVCTDANIQRGKLIEELKVRGLPYENNYQLIISSLSLHYFAESEKTISKFLRKLAEFAAPKSYFAVVILDGMAVAKLLHRANRDFKIGDGEKYHFKSKSKFLKGESDDPEFKFTDVKELPWGIKIQLKLPFSDGAFYDEYLVDPNSLISAIDEIVGMKLVESKSFDTSKLTSEDDIEFAKLYKMLIFRKLDLKTSRIIEKGGAESNDVKSASKRKKNRKTPQEMVPIISEIVTRYCPPNSLESTARSSKTLINLTREYIYPDKIFTNVVDREVDNAPVIILRNIQLKCNSPIIVLPGNNIPLVHGKRYVKNVHGWCIMIDNDILNLYNDNNGNNVLEEDISNVVGGNSSNNNLNRMKLFVTSPTRSNEIYRSLPFSLYDGFDNKNLKIASYNSNYIYNLVGEFAQQLSVDGYAFDDRDVLYLGAKLYNPADLIFKHNDIDILILDMSFYHFKVPVSKLIKCLKENGIIIVIDKNIEDKVVAEIERYNSFMKMQMNLTDKHYVVNDVSYKFVVDKFKKHNYEIVYDKFLNAIDYCVIFKLSS